MIVNRVGLVKAFTTFTSQYPPAHNDTYVKATTNGGSNFYHYYATNPAKSLVGSYTALVWLANTSYNTNQRFHIDLGSQKIINRIYYENQCNAGGNTNYGAKNFTFWGSDSATAFATVTYTSDTDWTRLFCSQSTFDQHVSADTTDPKYITVSNNTAYRYYALKFADGWGGPYIGFRRVELQTGS